MMCPVCGFSGEFKPFGLTPRPNARCPRCSSLERHRFAFMILQQIKPNYTRVLQVSGDCLGKYFQKNAKKYAQVDLAAGTGDLTQLALPDSIITFMYASHVLEHIKQDRKAISEIHRVLCADGIAMIQVPIYGEHTFEVEAHTPQERLRLFLQKDHVRMYGLDIVDKFIGFQCDTYYPQSQIRADEYGLSTGPLFVLTKPHCL